MIEAALIPSFLVIGTTFTLFNPRTGESKDGSITPNTETDDWVLVIRVK